MSKYYSECSECGANTKSTLFGKDGFVCKSCYNHNKEMINIGDRRPIMSLEKALEKTYEVRGYPNTNGRLQVVISCPQILIGRKVKLVLCDDDSQSHGGTQ